MLNITNLGHYYVTDDFLFRGLTVELEQGEVVAILGPNARGKTTLLKCIAGILQPVEGTVTHTGTIGYVPQNHGAAFPYPVIDIVVMGRARLLKAYQSPSKEDMQAALDALEQVGVPHLAYRQFNRLSGGQQQLVLIARSLVSSPDVVVLDEPASALDLRNQSLVLHVIKQLSERKISVLMTTHHPDHALYVANKALFLLPNTEHQVGPTDELFTNEQISAVYKTPVLITQVQETLRPRRIAVADYDADERALVAHAENTSLFS